MRCSIRLVLSSSSPYRKALLERLAIPFTTTSPSIDETPLEREAAQAMVIRLSLLKARTVALREPEAIIIGSDQAATLDERILGKPGTLENAHRQLRELSGRTAHFHTGLCVLNTATGSSQADCVTTHVTFRRLGEEEIARYLEREHPLDIAGSFKSEQLGISLLECTDGGDPTALIGLPLIRLCAMLRREGLDVP